MTPAQLELDVEVAEDEDVDMAVQRALDGAQVSLAELRNQAAHSRFSSERARMAWFVISRFVEPA